MRPIKTVMIIGDDDISDAIRLILENEGYDGIIVHDIPRGISTILNEDIKLVIYDVKRYNSEFKDITRELCRVAKQNDTEVLLLSHEQEILEDMGLENQDHIFTPFNKSELIRIIKAKLGD